jgi:GTP diphosphokinase / guanosine-3',5'-bis(diphosphate) 3'-diphosphatase
MNNSTPPLCPDSAICSTENVNGESDQDDSMKSAIDEMINLSSRLLFGPTFTPTTPRLRQVVSYSTLMQKAAYLGENKLQEIKKAFQFADKAHLGQYRQSGEPYITHPLEVAELCAEWNLDATTIMVALLHDVIEDTGVVFDELRREFGLTVAKLVDGLTKLDGMGWSSKETVKEESMRKVILAMAEDVRVILVKFADRLHNMRTLSHVQPAKRRRVAQETLDIFAPLAHRLGMNKVYRELQDLALKNIWPTRYRILNERLKLQRSLRENSLENIEAEIKNALEKNNIKGEVFGREKTLFSIHRKMKMKKLRLKNVTDVYAFRIVVEDILQCYTIIGIIHHLYRPLPDKFKDYIAIPKKNNYQSLHTTVNGQDGIPLEFQIRTKIMDHVAEKGIASHWLYKQGTEEFQEAQRQIKHQTHSILEIQKQCHSASEFIENLKSDLSPDAVFVYTPKGKIINLPHNATGLDFAYALHTEMGNHCKCVYINNVLQSLGTKLKNGDIVNVIRDDSISPTPGWLSLITTGRARSAIRHYLRTTNRKDSLDFAQRLLSTHLANQGIDLDRLPDSIWNGLFSWTETHSREELLMDLVLRRSLVTMVVRRIEMLLDEQQKRAHVAMGARTSTAMLLDGTEGDAVAYSHCCYPIPGDSIVGYLGHGEGLEVHLADCPTMIRMRERNPDHWTEILWHEHIDKLFDVQISVQLKNHKGAFSSMANDLARLDANIVHISTEDGRGLDAGWARVLLQIQSRVQLDAILRTLQRNPCVMQVKRSIKPVNLSKHQFNIG